MWMFGRPVPVGLIYSAWVLGPPLVLAVLLARTDSLSLCLQVAALAGVVMLVLLHLSFGDPAEVLGAVRARPGAGDAAPRPADGPGEGRAGRDAGAHAVGLGDGADDAARDVRAVPRPLVAVAAASEPGSFGAEFQQLRLGLVLGMAGGAADRRVAAGRTSRWSTTWSGCSWAR